jgi:uncharacterized protein DUF2490
MDDSRGGYGCRRACLVLCVCLVAAAAWAQDEPAKEFWPEVDIWWRFSPAWRASAFVPLSKNIDTHYREGNLILQGDFAWGEGARLVQRRLMDENRAQAMKTFLVRGGYLGGKSLDDHGDAYTEHSMLAELHVRTPLKGGVLLSNRLRADLRWLGDDPNFSNRWRYRVQVEKDFAAGRTSLVPYTNAEAYYDSRYDTVNRFRFILGTSVAWSPRAAVETNLTYQHDSHASATETLALNIILHVFFETGGAP